MVDEKYKQDKRNKTKQEQENDNFALKAALKLGMKFVLLPTSTPFIVLSGCEKKSIFQAKYDVLAKEIRPL